MCQQGFDYMEDEIYQAKDCWHCQEMRDKHQSAAVHLQEIIKDLYGKGELNLLELENSLDELCFCLDVKLIPGDLQIVRKKQKA